MQLECTRLHSITLVPCLKAVWTHLWHYKLYPELKIQWIWQLMMQQRDQKVAKITGKSHWDCWHHNIHVLSPTRLWAHLTTITMITPIIQYQNILIQPLGSISLQFQVIWNELSELKLWCSTPREDWFPIAGSQPLQKLKSWLILTVMPCHLLYV